MVEITQELLNKMFEYEPATGRLIWKDYPAELEPSKKFLKKFKTQYLGKEAGSKSCTKDYVWLNVKIKGRKYKAHRLIWCIIYGNFPYKQIDHIDHNPLNNRLDNLREVTPQENRKNSSLQKRNKSGFTGVAWCEVRNKWRAYVGRNGKIKHLGYYVLLKEAAQAAKKAREELGFHPNHGV